MIARLWKNSTAAPVKGPTQPIIGFGFAQRVFTRMAIQTIPEKLAAAKGALTSKLVAEIFGYHHVTIRKWIVEGKIPYTRVNGTIRFDPGVLAKWWKDRTVSC